MYHLPEWLDRCKASPASLSRSYPSRSKRRNPSRIRGCKWARSWCRCCHRTWPARPRSSRRCCWTPRQSPPRWDRRRPRSAPSRIPPGRPRWSLPPSTCKPARLTRRGEKRRGLHTLSEKRKNCRKTKQFHLCYRSTELREGLYRV